MPEAEALACDPHPGQVDTATLQAARDAGCDVVWPRSKFVADLAAALPQWFSAKPQGESSSLGG